MKLLLKRIYLEKNCTLGQLFIDDKYFCDTLEDPNRDLNKNGKFDDLEYKVYGDTCIPYGKYKILLNLSVRFKRKLPLLLDVPNFEGIRIHRGNSAKDTSGCILVGKYCNKNYITKSKITEQKLIKLIEKADKNNEEITIEIY